MFTGREKKCQPVQPFGLLFPILFLLLFFSEKLFSINHILLEAMAEFTLGYREVITDQELYEKWIEITLTTGEYRFYLMINPKITYYRRYSKHFARHKSHRNGWWLQLSKLNSLLH